MILLWLILILLGSGFLAWLTGRWSNTWPRIISLAATIVQLVMVLAVWFGPHETGSSSEWIATYTHPWIPAFGVQLKLAADGLTLLMLLLTSFVGSLAILSSWKSSKKNTGFYHFNLLLTLAGVTGVFLAMDLFLFYFFWEMMLIPMYFLISIWGNEKKKYAATKFFLFTQASGLLMFVSIITLFFIHGANTGTFTFDYEQLLGTNLAPGISFLLMLGFVAAFFVKLSTVPFHSWQPDAYTQSPGSGTVILAALMLKTGAYGLIRFVLPLFPEASLQFAPVAMAFGVISILYGAKLAFAQTDIKRLIAYTSISHMGFILLGIYAFTEMAMQGVVLQMVAHGITISALFILAGALHQRLHTRELGKMGGLWATVPKMGAMGLIFVLASLGLPGLGNFIAEILILIGSFPSSAVFTSIAALGMVAATIYSLRLMQKVFYGERQKSHKISDLGVREMFIMGALTVVIIWLGLYPISALNFSKQPVQNIIERVDQWKQEPVATSQQHISLFEKTLADETTITAPVKEIQKPNNSKQ